MLKPVNVGMEMIPAVGMGAMLATGAGDRAPGAGDRAPGATPSRASAMRARAAMSAPGETPGMMAWRLPVMPPLKNSSWYTGSPLTRYASSPTSGTGSVGWPVARAASRMAVRQPSSVWLEVPDPGTGMRITSPACPPPSPGVRPKVQETESPNAVHAPVQRPSKAWLRSSVVSNWVNGAVDCADTTPATARSADRRKATTAARKARMAGLYRA
jgi:hypothetical protein